MLLTSSLVKAQAFDEGTKHLNLGIGFGGYYGYVYVTGADHSSLPTIFISYDQGTSIELGPGIIGIGGFAGYSSASARYDYVGYSWEYSWSNFVIGARGTYHFMLDNDNLDLYGGLSIGLWAQTYEYKDTDPFYNGSLDSKDTYMNLYDAICFGGKYMFSEKFGVFAELGWDVAYLKAGVTLGL